MWREVEDGQLPSPRIGLRAAVVDDIIYVTAGDEGGQNYLTSILYWDPSAESWEVAGDLSVARAVHAAVSLPYSMIESGCSASSAASPTTFTPGMKNIARVRNCPDVAILNLVFVFVFFCLFVY